MTNLGALSVDELADGICLRAGRIAAAHAELLWIGEFDRREGWAGPGMLSCAHWLSWRIDLSLGTTRDQVRVARRLPDLPELAAAFPRDSCRTPRSAPSPASPTPTTGSTGSHWPATPLTWPTSSCLLCSRHHTVVHTRGFGLHLHADRRLDVQTSTGTPVPQVPAPQAEPGPLLGSADVLAETLPPDHTDPRLDLRYAIAVLMSQAA